MPTISVAVIVPTLDEEDNLRRHLPAVLAEADEVVVCDGGSRDATLGVARSLGARTVSGNQGRGPQLNRGARATSSEVLVFLHADTRLPSGAIEAVRDAVRRGKVGGGFLARFDDRSPLFRLGSALVNLRTRLTRAPLGDQAQFATRRAFDEIGGFPAWPILEDLDFIGKLKRKGEIAIIPTPVVTSARRYVTRGIARTLINNWSIWLLFAAGVSPQRLARRYRHVR